MKNSINKINVVSFDKPYHSGYIQKRDCFSKVIEYLYSDTNPMKVCALYGIRRTGKTVLMLQCIEKLTSDSKRCAMITCTKNDTMHDVQDVIRNQIELGINYFFIDEITELHDFQQTGNVLADVDVGILNAKIVITGTCSLGIKLASNDTLYDRISFVNTTFVPFSEYNRITGVDKIDQYLKFGSVLQTDTFSNMESTKQYIETSIVNNIINSLEKSEGKNLFPPALTEVYDNGTLNESIQRFLNKFSYSVTIRALRRTFKSSVVDAIDRHTVTDNLPDRIDINRVNNKVANLLGINTEAESLKDVSEVHLDAIESFLTLIGVFHEMTAIEMSDSNMQQQKIQLITHPGMYHAQLAYVFDELALEDSWLQKVSSLNDLLRAGFNWAAGRLLENVILSNLSYCLTGLKQVRLFDIGQDTGRWFITSISYNDSAGIRYEADVAVIDKVEHCVHLFEIKHSDKCIEEQSRWLESDKFREKIKSKFGTIKQIAVLYEGENDFSLNIPRLNIEGFLDYVYNNSTVDGFVDS